MDELIDGFWYMIDETIWEHPSYEEIRKEIEENAMKMAGGDFSKVEDDILAALSCLSSRAIKMAFEMGFKLAVSANKNAGVNPSDVAAAVLSNLRSSII